MSSLESIGRAILSLALVVGLMWLLGRWARGRGRKGHSARRGGRSRDGMEVLARHSLTRNATVAVIRIADRAMVLGITDAQVSLLGEFSPDVLDLAPVPVAATPTTAGPALVEAKSAQASKPARASKSARASQPAGRLDGSVLSLSTWSQALDFLRERTVRH